VNDRIFCDTSTLVKYYVNEAESAVVCARIDEAEEVTLSELARVELVSVFHRYWRDGVWNREQFTQAVIRSDRDDLRGVWTWLPIDRAIINYSLHGYLQLPSDVSLRASDCIHIASAIRSGHTEIHTHDLRQAKAAKALGLEAIRIS
jgi:predicted nucleic acid-binding protein